MLLSRIDLLVVKIRHFDKGQTGQETHSLVVKNNSVVKKSTILTKKNGKKRARNSASCCRVYISLSKSINLQIISLDFNIGFF